MSGRKLYLSRETIVQKVAEEFNGNVLRASKELRIPRRTLRNWLSGTVVHSYKRYIITYVQNDTKIHEGFWESLQVYMKEWKSELICYRGKYRNPTSQQEVDREKTPHWDYRIKPYLMDSFRELNDSLVLYPARTQPTAVNPLSGYDTHTGEKSGIFPHPKIRWETIATHHSMPKILTTTGALTLKNYSISKAGEKGKFHHVIGALIVEIVDDKKFHIRHINIDKDGSFYDIAGGVCQKYTPDGIIRKQSIDVLVMGDIQHPFVDDEAMQGSQDVISKFKPSRIYVHDLIDFWRTNHHEISNRFMVTAKNVNGEIDVRSEMRNVALWLQELSKSKKYEICIVRANHDEALERWLNQETLDKVGINAQYFHWLSYNKHRSAKRVSWGYDFDNMLEFAVSEFINLKKLNIRFLKRTEAEIRNGIDYSLHGDVGANGSRGNALSISKIGTKSVIGHSHSPRIIDGCYQVGVKAIIPLGYSKNGPSSWMHTDCIVYKNGKRTLVNYVNGEYYLDEAT